MKSIRLHATIVGFCALATVFLFLGAFPLVTTAEPEIVETYDSPPFILPVTVFGDGAMVFVTASHSSITGGSVIANITDEILPDSISITLSDDGTGPGDTPDDGIYTGNFTIRFDQGINGQFTDDVLDILDLTDGGVALITVDIDMLPIPDPGFAQVDADFTPPQVTINSGPDTVDLSYTLNATITDNNLDNSLVWYSVDGLPNQPFAWSGGDSFESVVDTSGLLNGPHTIRVIAYDVAGNFDDTQTVTITVAHPEPNISVTIEFDPPQPKEGDRVTITAVIDNTGNADANNVVVTFYVEDVVIDTQTDDIPAGGSRTVTTTWDPPEGSYDIRVEVDDPGGVQLGAAQSPAFDIQPADGDLLDNPWIWVIIITVSVVVIVVGTVAGAKYGKEMVKATRAKGKGIPAEEPIVPPEEADPCGEIRRKWMTIVAEYERTLAEMESAGQRATLFRKQANQAGKEADDAEEAAKDANQALGEAKQEIEVTKGEMHNFFSKGMFVDGISVGKPTADETNYIGYFKGLVKVYLRGPSYGEILNRFIEEHTDDYDELQDAYDELEEGMPELKVEAAKANREAVEAEARAREADRKAREAEQEHENLQREVESLKENAEAFRQKWRMCHLKRLREAANRASWAAEDLAEAAKAAQNADSASEFEEYKGKAEEAQEQVEGAKEQVEAIKEKLGEEGEAEDLDEIDDKIERAVSDAASALELVVSAGSMFYPHEDNLGRPCKSGETRVVGEYTMQYQFFDPTREIEMPLFYGVQTGGEAGKALSEYVRRVAEICGQTRGVIGEIPGGDLVGIPLDYWPTVMDIGTGALKQAAERPEGLGFIKMSGLAIPTVRVTVTYREVMFCRDGTWQMEKQRISTTDPVQSQMVYPRDDALPFNEAVDWVQDRLEKLMKQQRDY